MEAFRPTLTGLAPAFQPETPRVAAPSLEIITVSIIRSYADSILEALREAGGTLSAEALRDATDELSKSDRTQAMKLLRSQGEIESEGSTRAAVYYLPGHKPKRRPVSGPQLTARPPLPQLASALAAPTIAVQEPPSEGPSYTPSLELRFIATLECLADDPDFAGLDDAGKLRGAEWLASRLRASA